MQYCWISHLLRFHPVEIGAGAWTQYLQRRNSWQPSLDRRRVILLIAQSGDVSSRAQLRDVLRELELNNIVLYSLVMPRIGKDLIKNTISIGSTNGAFGRSDTGIMGTIDLGKLIPEIF